MPPISCGSQSLRSQGIDSDLSPLECPETPTLIRNPFVVRASIRTYSEWTTVSIHGECSQSLRSQGIDSDPPALAGGGGNAVHSQSLRSQGIDSDSAEWDRREFGGIHSQSLRSQGIDSDTPMKTFEAIITVLFAIPS